MITRNPLFWFFGGILCDFLCGSFLHVFFILQHSLRKYSIAACRILYKYVGDCPGKFPVLDHRASTHSLYDPSCFFKQIRINHTDHKTLVCILVVEVDLHDLRIVCGPHFHPHSTGSWPVLFPVPVCRQPSSLSLRSCPPSR